MKVDVSIVSFVLVLVIALPVTALRSQTYSVGYDIAELKSKERQLREHNLDLKAQLGRLEASLLANPSAATATDHIDWLYPQLSRVDVAQAASP
jgi:hypothetical protein